MMDYKFLTQLYKLLTPHFLNMTLVYLTATFLIECCKNIVISFYQVILSRHELLLYFLHVVKFC